MKTLSQQEVNALISKTPFLQSILYDLDMMPEHVGDCPKRKPAMFAIVSGFHEAMQKVRDDALEEVLGKTDRNYSPHVCAEVKKIIRALKSKEGE